MVICFVKKNKKIVHCVFFNLCISKKKKKEKKAIQNGGFANIDTICMCKKKEQNYAEYFTHY